MRRSRNPGAAGLQRASVLDRALATSRTISVTGPMAPLDLDVIRSRLARAWTPNSRLSLVPDPASAAWAHDVETRPQVCKRPDLADLPVGDIMTHLRNRPEPLPRLEVLVCGQWLVIDHTHGMGDGRLGVEQIAGVASRHEFPMTERFERSLPSAAAWQALRRHVLRHPRRLRDIVRLRAANAAPPTDAPLRTITDWRSTRCAVTAAMRPCQTAELKRAIADTGVRMSSAAVTVGLWRAALAAQGVPLDDRTQILFDCRRYLDAEHAEDHGNFAVGIPLLFPPDATPMEIGDRIRAVAESGWPAAILAAGELRMRLRPSTPGEGTVPSRVEVPDRLRLSVSDLGRVGIFGDLPWEPASASHHLFAYVEPDGPDAASMLVSEIDGSRSFTTTFCSDFVGRPVIEAALDHLCEDPVSLLDRLLTRS
ncbi:hypothetical protein [Gordonia sp. KTR9]|uniref:hypothetical protein n=1 Tax=Gordonia sp. KTR9 TaxID=337191 RepID=UPI00027DE416|nr:hypothetical protein [Gordonia sp. KTR9]AFR50303.1 hypothetical protein KTR9_3668 [Gordonia sp. KTR9]